MNLKPSNVELNTALFSLNRLLFEPAVLNAIKSFNASSNYQAKVIISGGEVLAKYFMYPEFRTLDYDLKIALPNYIYNNSIDDVQVNRVLFEEAVRFHQLLSVNLNYLYNIVWIEVETLLSDNNYELIYNANDTTARAIPFFQILPTENKPFSNFYFRVKHGSEIIYDMSFIDIYRATPKDVKEYYTFIYGTETLFEKHVDFQYYIPTLELEPYILYAGVGFIIWDTVRMINRSFTLEDNPNKIVRYIQKWAAIISAFNNMTNSVSCHGFLPFVRKCADEFVECGDSIDQLYLQLKNDGIISDDILQLLKNSGYSNEYLCDYFKRLIREHQDI